MTSERLHDGWDVDQNMDMQSLEDIKELVEMDLEASQELWCKCEIEERNALRAYRRTQKALIEANNRCNSLYKRREVYSAQLKLRMKENSTLIRSYIMQDHVEAGLDPSNRVPSVDNMQHLVISSHQSKDDSKVQSEQKCMSNIKETHDSRHNVSEQHLGEHETGSHRFNEHDSFTPEPCKGTDAAANPVCSLPSDANMLTDENDDSFSFKNKSANSGLGCQVEGRNYKTVKYTSVEASRNLLANDSMLLEANLRSQLVAKYRRKELSDNRGTVCKKARLGDEGCSQEKAETNLEIHKNQFITSRVLPISHNDGSEAKLTLPSHASNKLKLPLTHLEVNDFKNSLDGGHWYKNRLQNYLQQRNLTFPEYSFECQGLPHASYFRCKVSVCGQNYESRQFFLTKKEAENAAAKIAFQQVSANEVQEVDFGLLKNALQELAHKRGFLSPSYKTENCGPGHSLTFLSTVIVDDKIYHRLPAKSKKQAEVNAAKLAYDSLQDVFPTSQNGLEAELTVQEHTGNVMQSPLSLTP